MTADAQPVLHAVDISGLSARANEGEEAYVCNFGFESDPGSTITPVDLTGARADHRITTGSLPDAIASTPNGKYVLIADEGQDLLTIVNTSNGDVVARVATGLEPDAVAVSPNGRWALVANAGDDTVTPVDLQKLRSDPAIAVGHQPDAIAIGGPDGNTALVANLGSATVTPVDMNTFTAGKSIKVGDEPDAIAMSTDGATALVANLGSNSVTAIGTSTLSALRTDSIAIAPTSIATDGSVAWASGGTSLVPVSFDSGSVSGSAPGTAGSAVNVGRLVEAVAIRGSDAWVADQGPAVTEVDLIDGRVLRTIDVGGRPSAIVVPAPS